MEFGRVTKRALAVAIPLAVLTGCAATTTEGVSSAECLDGRATYTLPVGRSLFLGDLSSNELLNQGPHNDWFKVENHDGTIQTNAEHGKDGDNGKLVPTDEGFDYTENGNTYHVSYENPAHDRQAAIDVTVVTDCR